jgi:uncharacterized membrane protein
MKTECSTSDLIIKSIALGAYVCSMILFRLLHGTTASYAPIIFIAVAVPLISRKNIKPVPLFLIFLAISFTSLFISSVL